MSLKTAKSLRTPRLRLRFRVLIKKKTCRCHVMATMLRFFLNGNGLTDGRIFVQTSTPTKPTTTTATTSRQQTCSLWLRWFCTALGLFYIDHPCPNTCSAVNKNRSWNKRTKDPEKCMRQLILQKHCNSHTLTESMYLIIPIWIGSSNSYQITWKQMIRVSA